MRWSATRWVVSGAAAVAIVAGAPGCKRENPSWSVTSAGEGTSDTQPAEFSGGAPESSGASSGASSEPSGSGTQGLGTSDGLSTGPGQTTSAGETSAGSLTDTGASTTEGSGETDDTETDETSDTEEPLEPETEYLINYNEDAACDLPFWCHQAGNLNNGFGVNTEAAECFEPALPPPYELTFVHYKLWGALGPLANSLVLRVMSAEGEGPLEEIANIPLNDNSLASVGDHELELAEPIVIEGERFCLVLDGGENNTSAMGVAIDKFSAVYDVSFIRVPVPENNPCSVPEFVELFDIEATNHGNWCIDAEIRELLP